jgi:hypothetical protein
MKNGNEYLRKESNLDTNNASNVRGNNNFVKGPMSGGRNGNRLIFSNFVWEVKEIRSGGVFAFNLHS